jgi:enediyne polyketide synthase
MAHGDGFVHARYDAGGTRYEDVLCHLPVPEGGPVLGAGDVLLVAGGAKGIAAECALALAGGAAIAFLGRADTRADAVLSANLERLRAHYVRADVTNRGAVARAVAEVERALGPVTALLFAAGRNEPALVPDIDVPLLAATVAPKVAGLRNALAALERSPLRLLVTLGSLIARAGVRGEAHYALANEWQTMLTERFAATHPGCRCLAYESSVWSSVGMGERLGSVEALARRGVHAIAPDRGAALLEALLRHDGNGVTKAQLLRDVWGGDFTGDDNVVEVYVSYLRRKIDAPFGRRSLETVRPISGYRLTDA